MLRTSLSVSVMLKEQSPTPPKEFMSAAGMDQCKLMTHSTALREKWKETVIGPPRSYKPMEQC